jgi:hypothetical protein
MTTEDRFQSYDKEYKISNEPTIFNTENLISLAFSLFICNKKYEVTIIDTPKSPIISWKCITTWAGI